MLLAIFGFLFWLWCAATILMVVFGISFMFVEWYAEIHQLSNEREWLLVKRWGLLVCGLALIFYIAFCW
ncbi:hypothetical protein [Lacticaseibacillus phage Lphi2ADMT26]|nr:hypothetical protein [Lacticaseibacillus phage Lphi2ADMT26]